MTLIIAIVAAAVIALSAFLYAGYQHLLPREPWIKRAILKLPFAGDDEDERRALPVRPGCDRSSGGRHKERGPADARCRRRATCARRRHAPEQ
jgi:hypothetical protein